MWALWKLECVFNFTDAWMCSDVCHSQCRLQDWVLWVCDQCVQQSVVSVWFWVWLIPQRALEMSKEEFGALPGWKQMNLKKAKGLFWMMKNWALLMSSENSDSKGGAAWMCGEKILQCFGCRRGLWVDACFNGSHVNSHSVNVCTCVLWAGAPYTVSLAAMLVSAGLSACWTPSTWYSLLCMFVH